MRASPPPPPPPSSNPSGDPSRDTPAHAPDRPEEAIHGRKTPRAWTLLAIWYCAPHSWPPSLADFILLYCLGTFKAEC
ncbi:uncharacterized protein UV8b_00445 [Ustilaginoidea virens]|uniref:Uncharacterized protein n=1 Tax=Ustilaginoidea virens TaxID=1159556 RepID=A0A8E5HIR5_USTVR|nr:uncharacterized protein UV8b_00445 [Ustilaginoidea virens]QUC16204.1 hypothetical protein UV8b_00445 [Ustilaginoidea virens]